MARTPHTRFTSSASGSASRLAGIVQRLRRRHDERPPIDRPFYCPETDPLRPVQVLARRESVVANAVITIPGNPRRFCVELFCNNPGQGRFSWTFPPDDTTGVLIPINPPPLRLHESDHGQAVRQELYLKAPSAGFLTVYIAEFIYQ